MCVELWPTTVSAIWCSELLPSPAAATAGQVQPLPQVCAELLCLVLRQ